VLDLLAPVIAREPFGSLARVCRPTYSYLRVSASSVDGDPTDLFLFSDPAVKVARAILKTAQNRSSILSNCSLKGHFVLFYLVRPASLWERHTTTNLHCLLHLKISMEMLQINALFKVAPVLIPNNTEATLNWALTWIEIFNSSLAEKFYPPLTLTKLLNLPLRHHPLHLQKFLIIRKILALGFVERL
jgi:hypothetical protein